METALTMFERHFRVVLAESPEQLAEAHRLRYQVYCVEHGFERPEDCPGGLERDPYDGRSLHTLVQSTQTGATVGTVRLVLADGADPSRPFPIEEHCRERFRADFRPEVLPRRGVGEISRFALSRAYRKRQGEPESPHGLTDESSRSGAPGEERRVLPHLTIGLFRGIVQMSARAEVSHWYAVMETRLIRSLHRFGIDFPVIGDAVEYHGSRHPCMGAALEVLDGVKRQMPPVWEFITAGSDLSRLEPR